MKIKAREKERADRIREQEILLEREREQARLREHLNQEFQRELALYAVHGEDNMFMSKPVGYNFKKKKKTSSPTKSLEQIVLSDSDTALDEFLSGGDRSSTVEEDAEASKEEIPSVFSDDESIQVMIISGLCWCVDLTSPALEEPLEDSHSQSSDKAEQSGEDGNLTSGDRDQPNTQEQEEKVTDIDESWM